MAYRSMYSMAYRMMGALVLDRLTYEAVEAERRTTLQATGVVLLSSLAAGIGAAGWEGPDLLTLLAIATLALVSWLVWAALILYVGGVVLPERRTNVDYGQLIRTTGFAATPGVFQVFALLTPITVPVFVVSWGWMTVAMVVAVRQALDFESTWHALAVCVVTLLVVLGTTLMVGLAFERLVA